MMKDLDHIHSDFRTRMKEEQRVRNHSLGIPQVMVMEEDVTCQSCASPCIISHNIPITHIPGAHAFMRDVVLQVKLRRGGSLERNVSLGLCSQPNRTLRSRVIIRIS